MSCFFFVCLDGIIVYSKSFSDHLYHVRLVLRALQANNLVLNPPKCTLAVQQIDYLGHTINHSGIQPTQHKIAAILQIPEPRTLADSNSFIGALGWYRKFLPNFASIAAPIHTVTNLTRCNRRKLKWQQEQSNVFNELKQLLTTEPLFLHYPIEDLPLILTTDASNVSIGGVLQQEVNGTLRNLYYHSQIMSSCERKYNAIEKEALAIYKCFDRMRSFLLGRSIIVMTYHCPLCYIMQKTIKNTGVNRITLLLQEYNIDKILYIRGRYNCLPDYLSRYPQRHDDDLFNIEYGLANKNHLLSSSSRSHDTRVHNVSPVSDTTHQNLLATMTLRPRKQNSTEVEESTADLKTPCHDAKFATSPATESPKPFSSNYFDMARLRVEQSKDPHIKKILLNLQTTPYKFSFQLEDDILYKLLSSGHYSQGKRKLIYLPSSMISSLLRACHDNPMTGAHFSVDRTYNKLKNYFWWPNMKSTIYDYIQSCRLCKQHNISRHKTYGHLKPISPPTGPFELVGIDFCGPLASTPRENQYVLVITDYFTRHVTALALPNCTAETTAQALFNDFFCKYGIPSVILSDQGTHFQNKLMENLQKLIGYNHIYSTAYHPQTNGIIERFNATFIPQISKLQDTQANNWDEYLQAVVFAYNSGVHKITKFSPYELLFGRTPRLPIYPRSTQFTFTKPNDYFEQLKRTLRIFRQASKENILQQQKLAKIRYDRHRLNLHLTVGNKVLTRIYGLRVKLEQKFSPIPKTVVSVNHPVYTVEDTQTHELSQMHIYDLRPLLLY